jgi:hypothetical protein
MFTRIEPASLRPGAKQIRRGRGSWRSPVRALLVLAAIVLCGIPRLAGAEESIVEVTAKLVEIPSKFPPDDLYDYAYVMRYEVIGGPLDKSSILVAHYKPRQARAKIKDKMKDYASGKLRSFTVGDVHKMRLSPELKKVWKGPLVDEFAATDRKSVRYWCLQVDPA